MMMMEFVPEKAVPAKMRVTGTISVDEMPMTPMRPDKMHASATRAMKVHGDFSAVRYG